MSRGYRFAALLPFLLLLSCAAPAELARRSTVALEQGDAAKAYDLARKALDHEPGNAPARAAMTAAANTIGAEMRARVMRLAPVDTVAAAEKVLDYSEFRAEVARYNVTLAPDTAYRDAETVLRSAAGRIYYGIGVSALRDGRPKYAYGEFTKATRYVSAYLDLDAQMQRSWNEAQTRVALLPVRFDSGRGALSRELTDHLYQKLAGSVRGESFRFTRMIPEEQVWNVVTVGQLGHLERDEGLRLARKLGAQRVIWMSVGGVDADTRTDSFRDQIYQKFSERDTSGRSVERWRPVDLQVVMRERTVHLGYEFDVMGTDEEQVLARRGDELTNVARTVYTAFQPQSNVNDYALCPPPIRAQSPERAKQVETRYKDVVGSSLPLPKLLERAKRDRGRTSWRPEYRNDFLAPSGTPVFLDDLPPAADLAFAALIPTWEKMRDELARLDAVDDVDAPPVEAPR